MNSLWRWTIIVSILVVTFCYSVYQRSLHGQFFRTDPNQLILENFPKMAAKNVVNGELIDREVIFNKNYEGVVVHFWGTWCAPCEVEFPELMEMVNKFSGQNILFVILAVNDDIKKVKKFLKRFKNLSSNAFFAIDNSLVTMENFGINKVPETYIFDKNAKHLKKFVGPQKWNNAYYFNTIYNLLISNKQ